MSKRLEKKIALVTGAASGIGKAIAEAFAVEGASVIGADLNDTEVPSFFTHFMKLDVTKGEQWEKVVSETVTKYHRLDILVNCAGVAPPTETQKPVWEIEEKTWDFVNGVNSTGVFLGCKYGAKHMVTQEPHPNGDRGWIINLASIYGQVASPTIVPYVASKHACVGITRAVAMDCAPFRVHVNALCPGYVNSPMTTNIFEDKQKEDFVERTHPFRGQGKPDDIAKAALFLASPENTWMTGSLMTVDGGYTVQ